MYIKKYLIFRANRTGCFIERNHFVVYDLCSQFVSVVDTVVSDGTISTFGGVTSCLCEVCPLCKLQLIFKNKGCLHGV